MVGTREEVGILAWHTQSPRFDPQNEINRVWWDITLIPTSRRWRQKDHKYKVIFGYIRSSRPPWCT